MPLLGKAAMLLSFDIEEYFHAEVFSGVVRREQWSGLESRVARTTELLLEIEVLHPDGAFWDGPDSGAVEAHFVPAGNAKPAVAYDWAIP